MQKVIDKLVEFVETQAGDSSLSQKCKNIFTNFKTKMNENGNKPCPTSDCSDKCKTDAELFGDGCGNALDGDSADVTLSTLRR